MAAAEQLGEQRFGSARLADEHEPAVRGERDHRAVDERRIADELLRIRSDARRRG